MLDFLLDALATQRLTRLAIEDVITQPLRDAIFEKHPPHAKSPSYILTCHHCSSMWIGFGVAAARTIAPKAWRPLSYALALSSVTGLIEERR